MDTLWQQTLAGRQLTAEEVYRQLGDTKEVLEWLKAQPSISAVYQKDTQHFYCRRCQQQATTTLYGTNRHYCTHCIQLGRMLQDEPLYRFPAIEPLVTQSQQPFLTWYGTLSPQQQMASERLLQGLTTPKPQVVYAVTGAGKTEMLFQTINHILMHGGRVAVVSPRVDVCLELAPRLAAAFANTDIVTLHGQQSDPFRYTPLVISTIHQLWRFYQAFDLIIVDEVDAFPLTNDLGLHTAIKQALKAKGKLIYLTATPDTALFRQIRKQQVTVIKLPVRFHQYPLPEPIYQWLGDWRNQIEQRHKKILWQQLQKFLAIDGVKLIFMPHIALAEQLFAWLDKENLTQTMAVVHAKDPKRHQKIQQLRQGTLDTLITTTILERGVTFPNCHVFIVGAEDPQFSSSALVQMSGRVGRSSTYPTGTLIYGHYGISWRMHQAKKQIRHMNRLAQKKGLLNE